MTRPPRAGHTGLGNFLLFSEVYVSPACGQPLLWLQGSNSGFQEESPLIPQKSGRGGDGERGMGKS